MTYKEISITAVTISLHLIASIGRRYFQLPATSDERISSIIGRLRRYHTYNYQCDIFCLVYVQIRIHNISWTFDNILLSHNRTIIPEWYMHYNNMVQTAVHADVITRFALNTLRRHGCTIIIVQMIKYYDTSRTAVGHVGTRAATTL